LSKYGPSKKASGQYYYGIEYFKVRVEIAEETATLPGAFLASYKGK